MKAKNVIIGILIIAFAIFGILEVSGVVAPLESTVGGISFVQIIGVLILLGLFVNEVAKRRIVTSVFIPAFIFMIIERNVAFACGVEDGNVINNWLLLLFTAIICVGVYFIVPRRVRIKKSHVSSSTYSHDDGTTYKEHNLGAATEIIDCATFTRKHFENNLGQTVIRFENVSEYVGEGVIYIENNLGNTVIHVPSDWRVVANIENNLGALRNSREAVSSGPVLYIEGENNLGALDIVNA